MASIWIDANGTGHTEPTCDEFHGLPDMPVNDTDAERHRVVICADCEPHRRVWSSAHKAYVCSTCRVNPADVPADIAAEHGTDLPAAWEDCAAQACTEAGCFITADAGESLCWVHLEETCWCDERGGDEHPAHAQAGE